MLLGEIEELTGKQLESLSKDLGYSYRGKNQWLYFLSFEPGYYPYNMDESEVLRMSTYLQDLELALRYYKRPILKLILNMGICFYFHLEKDKRHGILVSTFTIYIISIWQFCLSQMRNCFQTCESS